jgi:hypothetical protein
VVPFPSLAFTNSSNAVFTRADLVCPQQSKDKGPFSLNRYPEPVTVSLQFLLQKFEFRPSAVTRFKGGADNQKLFFRDSPATEVGSLPVEDGGEVRQRSVRFEPFLYGDIGFRGGPGGEGPFADNVNFSLSILM